MHTQMENSGNLVTGRKSHYLIAPFLAMVFASDIPFSSDDQFCTVFLHDTMENALGDVEKSPLTPALPF
jgi:hypothetical protein